MSSAVADVDVCIIGSGPAAYTAALYVARAMLSVVVFEGPNPGGQLVSTTDVENYPGFDEPINGFDLVERMKKQCMRFGAQMVGDTVASIDGSRVTGQTHAVAARAIIVATGASAKKLSFPGADELWNRGISACAVCDGALPCFRKRDVAVIGGGDTAMEEALFLSKYASRVYIIHRRDKFRASAIMQQRVLENPKIRVLWNREVVEAHGEKSLEGIWLRDTTTTDDAQRHHVEVRGLFYAIGHERNVGFLPAAVARDDDGCIKVLNSTTHTTVENVFACGDVADKRYRQAITAAGTGCQAGLDAIAYLESLECAAH